MTGPRRKTWLRPRDSPSHLRALTQVWCPNPCFLARPASWLNLEKPETEVGAGDAGWLWRSPVRYCSFTDSRESVSCREDAGETTLGLPWPPAPNSPCHFPPPQLLGGQGGGCWSWGTFQAAGLKSASIATPLGGRATILLSTLSYCLGPVCIPSLGSAVSSSFSFGFRISFGVVGLSMERQQMGRLKQMEPTVT